MRFIVKETEIVMVAAPINLYELGSLNQYESSSNSMKAD